MLAIVVLAGAAFGLVACGGSARPSGDAGAGTAVSFAACLRAHGMTDYPDPEPISHGGSEGIRIATPDLSSPKARAAARACRKLLPGGSSVNSTPDPRKQARLLAFARCMRARGIPDFPDPTSAGGFPPAVGRFDRGSPSFGSALKRCLPVAGGAIGFGPRGNPTWPVEP